MRRNLKNEIRACENDMKIHQAQISRKHGILESRLPCWIVKRVEEDGSDKKGGRCYIYTEAQVTNTVKKHFKRRIFFYTLIPLLGTKQCTKQREEHFERRLLCLHTDLSTGHQATYKAKGEHFERRLLFLHIDLST